jgi:hypothetical protein
MEVAMIYKIKYLPVIIILFLSFSATSLAAVKANETLHYDVVAEYIRSLGTIHNLQQTSVKEFQSDNNADNPPVAKMMSAIRNSTRMKLELKYSITTIKGMKLNKPFETLLPTTIEFYKEKVKLHDELIEIAKIFLVDKPKPGIDYSKMAARMPEITATLEYLDESIFKTMVLVFALLIDEKPDNEGHMSHLNITKAQRQKLIDNINGYFGESLDKQNKNWTVSSAALLRLYLLKDYKCTDEWQ